MTTMETKEGIINLADCENRISHFKLSFIRKIYITFSIQCTLILSIVSISFNRQIQQNLYSAEIGHYSFEFTNAAYII